MTLNAYAEVKRLIKNSTSYDVEVAFSVGTDSFNITVGTGHTDPQKAIEEARQHLYEMGAALAKAFDQPGTLT